MLVSPVLHNNAPVTPVAVNTELSQLFTTSTIGDPIFETDGAAVAIPAVLEQPFTVCVTV